MVNRAELESEINRRVRRDGPYRAEIVPERTPLWHVLMTAPTEENLAAAHLIGRGFGVYVPTFERVWMGRGGKRTRQLPLFPGHVFLFVWNVERHWRRIRACPGVHRILTIEERPVVVEDAAINRMQAIEFSGIEVMKPRRRRRRR